MTGYVHSYESFGTLDGPGIRFVVFLQGCPMRCKFCHNPDTWNLRNGNGKTAQEVYAYAMKYKSYFKGNGGVTISGGEPLLQLDFLTELLTLFKESGVHTCVDTSGICFDKEDERYEKLLPLVDLFLLDIKHIDEEGHRSLTGQSGEKPRAFAKFLSDHNRPVWIRCVLVPGISDGDEVLTRTRAFIDTLENVEKVEVLPYHTLGVQKYQKLGIPYPLEGVKPPSKESVENARRILKAE